MVSLTAEHCPTAERLAWPVLAALVLLAGCRTYDLCDPCLEPQVPRQMELAREKSMVSLPAYRIEPPDVLQIEMLRLVPRPPYRAEPFDSLQITESPPLPARQEEGGLVRPMLNYGLYPPSSNFLVEADGRVNLGAGYGSVTVVGMTIDEIKEAIRKQLVAVGIVEPDVSVQLANVANAQPVTGQYLVAQDGTVNLRKYGTVHVAGKTVNEARLAIKKQLEQFLDSPEPTVDVLQSNSKFYYILTEGAGEGDNLMRIPITGNDTVLDALSQVRGLSRVSSKRIWIARPAPGRLGCEQVLPVDYAAITKGGDTATNYQVMPGDRVFVAQDEMIALRAVVDKLVGPFERFTGFLGLGISTTRSGQLMGRDFNRTRSGF